MPGTTLSQRVEELQRLLFDLTQRVALVEANLDRMDRLFEPVLRDWSKTLDRLDKLERVGDQWSTRAWGLAEKLLIAVIGAAVGGFVTYLVKR